MNQSELIEKVAQATELNQAAAGQALKAVVNAILAGNRGAVAFVARRENGGPRELSRDLWAMTERVSPRILQGRRCRQSSRHRYRNDMQ